MESGSVTERIRHSVGEAGDTEGSLGSSQPRSNVRGSHPVNQTADAVSANPGELWLDSWIGKSRTSGSPSRRIGGISGSPCGMSVGSKWAAIRCWTHGNSPTADNPVLDSINGERSVLASLVGTSLLTTTFRIRIGMATWGEKPREVLPRVVFVRRTKTNLRGAAAPLPARRSTDLERWRPINRAETLSPKRPRMGCGIGSGPNLRLKRRTGVDLAGVGLAGVGFGGRATLRLGEERDTFFMGGIQSGRTWVQSDRQGLHWNSGRSEATGFPAEATECEAGT